MKRNPFSELIAALVLVFGLLGSACTPAASRQSGALYVSLSSSAASSLPTATLQAYTISPQANTATPAPIRVTIVRTPRPTLAVDDGCESLTRQEAPACPLGCTVHMLTCDIKGNISISSGDKIYHLPGSEFYEKTRIDPDYGERWFCTQAEAEANGWRAPRPYP